MISKGISRRDRSGHTQPRNDLIAAKVFLNDLCFFHKKAAGKTPAALSLKNCVCVNESGENLFRFEEAGDFDETVGVAIGGMHHVLHHLGAEVAADRALGGFAGIGRAE